MTANLLRLKRYSAVFEVYNPYSILQFSEVLSDFRIMAARRLLYHGKAVVSNLLNTGIVMVCEVTLDDGWVEVDFLAGMGGSAGTRPAALSSQFANFMDEWKRANRVEDPFKLVVADMANMFTGVQHWLTGVDVGIRTTVTRRRDELEHEIFSGIESRVVEEVLPAMERFEAVLEGNGRGGGGGAQVLCAAGASSDRAVFAVSLPDLHQAAGLCGRLRNGQHDAAQPL